MSHAPPVEREGASAIEGTASESGQACSRTLAIDRPTPSGDRLRVLYPNDPGSYYRQMDLVTPDQLDRLQAG